MAANNQVKLEITAENKADKAIEGVKTGLEKLGFSADAVKEQLGGVAAALTVGGLIELVRRSIDAADEMNDLAAKTGIATERLSAYQLAANQSGTSLDGVAQGLTKLARNMAQAAVGTGTAATSFKAIGVSVVDANGHLRDSDTVLQEVADRFASYNDGTAKAALAQQIFGRSGADLIPMLNLGSQGLKDSADQAKRLGAILGGDTAREADAFNDKMSALKLGLGAVGTRIAAELLPTLNSMSAAFMDSVTSTGTLDRVAEGLAATLKLLVSIGSVVATVFSVVGDSLGSVAAAVVQAVQGNFAQAYQILKAGGQDIVASVRQSASTISKIWSETPTGPTGGENKGTRTDAPVAPAIGAGKSAAAARLAALKADIAAQLALLKDANARALADLDQQLKDHKVSLQQYYADRVRLEQQAIDAEIAAQRKALAESPAQADRIKIENQIILLERQRGDAAVKAARAQEDAEKRLNDQIGQVRAALLRAQGQTGEATKQQLQAQYKDLLASLEAQGDASGVSLVRKLIDVSGAQADLQQVEADYQRALTAMQTAEQGVQAQVTVGLLTQAQGQQKIAALHRETAAQVTALIPKMEELAAATGNPDAILRVQRIKQQIAQLGDVVDANTVRLKGALQNDLAQFFETIATGSRNAGDAFRSFAQSVVADIAKMASEALAASAIKQLFAAAGGSGWGAAIAGAASAAGYASGGMVHGPGSATSDSIPARLSAGEFVVNAQAVKRVGAGMLHAINSLGHGPGVPHGPRLGFAEGGMVPFAPAQGGQQGAQQGGPSVRIVNVVDPALAGEWVNSPSGEKAIINILQRNAGAVKQVLA